MSKKIRIKAPKTGSGGMGTTLGMAGLLAGTLILGLTVALFMRLLLNNDAFNPFDEESSGIATATPFATPNPEFQAEALGNGDLGEPWSGTERVTILLMGADTRPGDDDISRPRSDTMILLMVDPEQNVASMLSIPRDLFVEVPGYGLQRINTAYAWGGPELAISTVQYNFGVYVNHYVMVEFDVFTTVVDEIGGIDIYVPEPIYDARYPTMDYGYEVFQLNSGYQHLDGTAALKYARTRHGNSDFDRAQRQQDVLFAIRDRVLDADMLPTLIGRAPSIYAAVSDGVTTDLTLDQMTSLALLVQDIPRESIRSGVIDANYTTDYFTETGAQVLIPRRDLIGPYLSTVFWLN